LADRDSRLAAWESRFKSFGIERDSETQKLLAQLAERDRRLSDWEAHGHPLAADREAES
jgi:hypothetical protein